ncbi:TIGR03087 family PEP-CTERM/XrtA system glycosyltransferase [Catenovulum adriaticum]|uniref:TIGR03087 family PEP-CTERM/XrtA system glycosyltransferase n=1 Tax=Catenovulum adriaticum TaxID=2984846 RepID=A0ABY7APP7_9ALTE|nr:TIGR03087 family PEP-CTERM/XrtA system glycosyltransferase [Catenovulum sp. TS8]WAJ70707.1 TIGR03087 family PEP-CTERM/XrtA system glycosyltransferase [Catenovulum sp. TS8]
MEPLLFLCHRIPFPPNKGDKIRSFNILKYLSQSYDIYLGAFVDDENDWQYLDALKPYCKSSCILPLPKKRATIKGCTAFLTGNPITIPYYADWQMKAWVEQVVASHIELSKAFIYSSSMAQYLERPGYNFLTKVIDFVDVDSDKWRQYAQGKRGIMRWVYHREYKRLAQYENDICAHFQASIFVSQDEAEHFKQRQSEANANKVHAIQNGVDSEYFNTNASGIKPLITSEPSICFTGAMDYWANVDAVVWFCEAVWPELKKQIPQLTFNIVGGNPTEKVKALSRLEGVNVTGRVEDVRPYIKAATLVVAPMRIARGIQNKVLEAMAMSKTVVMTSMAAEGIQLPFIQKQYIQDDEQETIKVIKTLFSDQESLDKVGSANLEIIQSHYQWQAVLKPFDQIFIE